MAEAAVEDADETVGEGPEGPPTRLWMASRTARLAGPLYRARDPQPPITSPSDPKRRFKTLKYSPRFPARFTSLADCRTFVDEFFQHYNHHHRHSGIGLHTPADVHHGLAEAIRLQRQHVLDTAYNLHPNRFRRPPSAPHIPEAAWINEPPETPLATTAN